jgi:hypothetical protein
VQNLPKSLHTVRVLTVMARLIRADRANYELDNEGAVSQAADALGYPGYPTSSDDYSLKAKAVAQLDADERAAGE